MTIVKNHREYKINNTTYFVEQYADKPHFVWFWRYGYVDRSGLGRTIGDMLRTRPNIKRLSLTY